MEEVRDQTGESEAIQRLAIVETAYHPRTAKRQGGGSVTTAQVPSPLQRLPGSNYNN